MKNTDTDLEPTNNGADFLQHLLEYTTAEEERFFNEATQENFKLCSVHHSLHMRMGKRFTSLLRHGSPLTSKMYSNGAVDLKHVYDHLYNDVNPAVQFSYGRMFAAFLNGNNKQRFFLEVYVNDAWFLDQDQLPWKIFIGCTQGHTRGVVSPSVAAHHLSTVELDSFGWIFHATDKKYEGPINRDGLRRYGRDSLHFMSDNDGSKGYIRKGAGTVPPRHYSSTRFCVLNIHLLIEEGYDLFLTQNGVILIYDDLPSKFFNLIEQFPYLGCNCFNKTSGHGLPPEVRSGVWRPNMTALLKYTEYLSSDEISKYVENDQLVENRVPRNPFPKRRQTAWEFMGQEKMQSVQIITGNPWHLFQSGIFTLGDNKGERVLNPYGEPVLIVREFFRLATSQQEELRSQGINRLVWERLPFAGHAIMFFTRAWEIGRMTAYVKNYSSDEDRDVYNQKLAYYENVGWLRDSPEPFKARPDDENPASKEREKIEEDEDLRDKGELRMFDLFAEAIADLYIIGDKGILEHYVRKTSSLGSICSEITFRPSGEVYLVDPDPYAPTPTTPTAENLCVDIRNNLKFSPRFCFQAVERKLEETHETLAPGTFADFAFGELKQYVESRTEIQYNFYKHLVINAQTRTFEDPNYVNSIGSKVVIRPLAESLELSVKRNQQLQRTMVHHEVAAEGDSPSGEIPEETAELAVEDSPPGEMSTAGDPLAGDLPSGEMQVEEPMAEVPEDLPSGKRSRTEAKEEEDVEMEAPEEEHEEPPQDELMQRVVDMPDYDLDDEDSAPEEEMMERATALIISTVYEHFAFEEEPEARGSGEFVPTKAMAKFLHRFLGSDFMDEVLEVDEEAKRIREGRAEASMETEVKEEQVYGEELEERKYNDIFTHTSSKEFLQALAPETEDMVTEGQKTIEEHLMSVREGKVKLNKNKMTKLEPLEPKPKTQIEIPEPKPCEDPQKTEPEYECALDKLEQLDKQHKDKDFGFYGKYFRQSHSRNLNFYKYRKANPVGHPHARFEIDEENFMEVYCLLYFEKYH